MGAPSEMAWFMIFSISSDLPQFTGRESCAMPLLTEGVAGWAFAEAGTVENKSRFANRAARIYGNLCRDIRGLFVADY